MGGMALAVLALRAGLVVVCSAVSGSVLGKFVDHDSPPCGAAATTDLYAFDEAVLDEIALGAVDRREGVLAQTRQLAGTQAVAHRAVVLCNATHHAQRSTHRPGAHVGTTWQRRGVRQGGQVDAHDTLPMGVTAWPIHATMNLLR